jgi:His/Glu/Gln/Arg/opine family amino acid ABC transporter permease subunit
MINLHGYGVQILWGLSMTVQAAIASFALCIVLGLLAAGAKLSHNRVLRSVAETYTVVIRGVPDLLLLFMVYFGLTLFLEWVTGLFGYDEYVEVPPFAAGVACIGFVYGAFATEVFRGAILAVPKGQIEAAIAVGMSRFLMWRRILLPQVMRYAIPGLGNVWLVLLKATALMSVVNLDELTRKAFIGSGATRDPLSFFITAAALYLMLTIISNMGLEWLERRASRGVRRA